MVCRVVKSHREEDFRVESMSARARDILTCSASAISMLKLPRALSRSNRAAIHVLSDNAGQDHDARRSGLRALRSRQKRPARCRPRLLCSRRGENTGCHCRLAPRCRFKHRWASQQWHPARDGIAAFISTALQQRSNSAPHAAVSRVFSRSFRDLCANGAPHAVCIAPHACMLQFTKTPIGR